MRASCGKIEALLGDASPLVRAMAVWAMRQLTRDAVGERVRHRHLAREGDSAVRAEWHARLHELPVLLRARLQRAGARRGSSSRKAGASAERRARGDGAESAGRCGLRGWSCSTGTRRAPRRAMPLEHATHVLLSIPPDADGDPVLAPSRARSRSIAVDRMDRLPLDRRRLWRSRRRLDRRDDARHADARSAAAGVLPRR